MRIDETISGVKADLAIKIFGDDFRTLDALGQQVLRAVSTVRGAADAQMEITSGVAELSVRVDRAALARYGLNVTDVEEAVASGGSGRCDFRSDRRPETLHRGASPAGPLPHRSRRDAQDPAARARRRTGPLEQVARVEVRARPGNDQSRRGPAAHCRDVQCARPRSGKLCRRSSLENRTRRQAAARLFHRVWRAI